MDNNDKNQIIEEANLLSIIMNLDAGKALVATIIIAIIGFITKIMSDIYMIVYWKPIFDYFNIPEKFYVRAVNSSINVYAIVIAIVFSILHFIFLDKITSALYKHYDRREKNRIVMLIIAPIGVYLAELILFFDLIIYEDGKGVLIFIIYAIMAAFITLGLVWYRYNARFGKDKLEDMRKSFSFKKFAAVICTLFICSLAIVYLVGYFNIGLDWYDLKSIAVDGEDTSKKYVQLLDIEEGYLCMPIEMSSVNEGEEGEDILNINTKEYRIIPKDVSVTVSDNKAWMYNPSVSRDGIFKTVNMKENQFFAMIITIVIVSIALVYVEIKYI